LSNHKVGNIGTRDFQCQAFRLSHKTMLVLFRFLAISESRRTDDRPLQPAVARNRSSEKYIGGLLTLIGTIGVRPSIP
jgi:hypothetical protein